MRKYWISCAIGMLVLTGVAWAGVAGDWDVTAETSWGETYYLTLSLVEEGGKITGTLGTPEGKTELQNAKLEGNQLTFDVWVSGSSYSIKAEVDGDQISGTWTGGGDSGTVKAKRKTS